MKCCEENDISRSPLQHERNGYEGRFMPGHKLAGFGGEHRSHFKALGEYSKAFRCSPARNSGPSRLPQVPKDQKQMLVKF